MNAVQLLRSILNAIICCCQPKYYVYRFDVYSGQERSNDIDDTNVVGYRFINQGNTECIINGGLHIPAAAPFGVTQIPGFDIDLTSSMRGNEIDTTIYKIKFVSLNDPATPDNNCLLVISKCIATKRAGQMVSMRGHSLPVRKRPSKGGRPPELEVTMPSAPQKIPLEYEE